MFSRSTNSNRARGLHVIHKFVDVRRATIQTPEKSLHNWSMGSLLPCLKQNIVCHQLIVTKRWEGRPPRPSMTELTCWIFLQIALHYTHHHQFTNSESQHHPKPKPVVALNTLTPAQFELSNICGAQPKESLEAYFAVACELSFGINDRWILCVADTKTGMHKLSRVVWFWSLFARLIHSALHDLHVTLHHSRKA